MRRAAITKTEKNWSEYRTLLHHFIRKRINDSQAAEDLVQEVLTKALQRIDQLQDQTKLLPWLYQLTRNAIVDFYRKHEPAKESDAVLANHALENDKSAEHELACCIMPFLEQLPAVYQQALMLSEIEGLTQSQVAVQQGISLSGAKSRVQRGRQMLKEKFLQCCRIERDRRGGVAAFEPETSCENC